LKEQSKLDTDWKFYNIIFYVHVLTLHYYQTK